MFVHEPRHVPFDIVLGGPRTDHWDFGLQKHWHRLGPLVRAGRVSKTGLEENKTIKVRVEGLEHISAVHRVEVIDVSSDLHLSAKTVLDDSAEWVSWCPFGQREFTVSVNHAFRTNEVQVD